MWVRLMNEDKKILSQDVKDRKIEVKEDGSIKVTELLETVYEQQYRDFLTDYRNMQKYMENIKETLTDDFKKKQKENIEKIQKEQDKISPFLDEAEKNWREHTEKEQNDNMLKGLRDELNKKDRNETFLAAAYNHFKKNEKLLSQLTNKEKLTLTKISKKHR